MQFFKCFSSNTEAGSANQFVFGTENDEISTGRVFYKISNGGLYDYSLLFSNIIDSTYMDGSECHKNMICDSWEIVEARVGKCLKNTIPRNFTDNSAANEINNTIVDFYTLTFNGKVSKTVAPGEFFCCDAFPFDFESGDFLCLEMRVRGANIPYHIEAQIPAYTKTKGGWNYSKKTPFAAMVGCNRPVKAKVCYLGDSITQGCGTTPNGYRHWTALLSQKLGYDYSYWNLGIGYARANDAATDGAWLFKVKQNDIIIICIGVNDIYHECSETQAIKALDNIVKILKRENKTVIIQTIPPFDFNEKQIEIWKNVNKYILDVLSKKVDFVFDVVPYMCESVEHPHIPKYDAHPNDLGSQVWADAFYRELNQYY